ncbi:hypothetical protein [Pseudomonas yamanorum]
MACLNDNWTAYNAGGARSGWSEGTPKGRGLGGYLTQGDPRAAKLSANIDFYPRLDTKVTTA